jgi:hypothetical protein
MVVCLVWLSLMTGEGEIGMNPSAPGDSRGAGTFFIPCNSRDIRDLSCFRDPGCVQERGVWSECARGTSMDRVQQSPSAQQQRP